MDDAPIKRKPGRPKKAVAQVVVPAAPETEPVASPIIPPEGPRKLPVLQEREFEALLIDGLNTQENRTDLVRFDSLGRKWRFEQTQRDNYAIFRVELTRMADVRERTMSSARFGTEGAASELETVIRELSEALG